MPTTTQQRNWLFSPKWGLYLKDPWLKPFKLLDKYERWRRVAKIFKISKDARLRLDWIIYYYDGHSAVQTARHFGMARKTFYKWFGEFDKDNIYSLRRLEDKSRAPKKTRESEITPLEEQRIIELRKEHIRYGKMKLKRMYFDLYRQEISSWKIQRVIQEKNLYFNPVKTAKIKRKRQKSQQKKRITELQRIPWFKKRSGYIICLDVIVVYWNNLKRYIFTAIDKYGKVAFARMYKSKSTINGRDFLYRLDFLLDHQVPRVGHDNGSEFKKYFEQTCQKLKIDQYWSRPRTPKDNPESERFNRTLEEEFLVLGNFSSEPKIFNRKLTEWLIEYNFKRPHQALGYKTPIEFSKVLPMYSSCTNT